MRGVTNDSCSREYKYEKISLGMASESLSEQT